MRGYTTKDFLEVATCGLSKQNRDKRLFAMLAAHVDDSGSQREGPVFVLSGYVADTHQWKRFSDQWQIALDLSPRLKLVKIQHALRFEEGWGRYRGVARERERDKRLQRFASIIHKHVQFSVTVSTSWKDMMRIQREFSHLGKLIPYSLLFNAYLHAVCFHLSNLNSSEKVDFVFDEQGALGRIALSDFDKIRDTLPPKLAKYLGGRPIHRDDEAVLPLQSAHTIAWLIRRYAHENNLTDDLSGWQPRQRCLRKLGKIPAVYTWYPYERLAPLIEMAHKTRTHERETKEAKSGIEKKDAAVRANKLSRAASEGG